jgi:DNA polymerase bacteriophage-type
VRHCWLDTEARSRTPIRNGLDLYCRDAECRIVTFKIDGASTRIWFPYLDPVIPADLRAAIDDPECLFIAHSAQFDIRILAICLKIRIALSRWRCTQAIAYTAGLPGSLESVGIALGLPHDQQKLVDDSHLIHLFCEPHDGRFVEPAEKPDEWARFCAYAIKDTDALAEVYKRLPLHNFQGVNLDWWRLNFMENARGFKIDAPFARIAVKFLERAKEISDAAVSDATGNEVTAATQRNRLLNYLNRRYEAKLTSLRAADVRDLLESDDIPVDLRYLLEMRLEAAKSSGSKYKRALAIMGPGDRLRNCVQFNGAGKTGRNSHKGFQPGNLARPVLNVRREFGPKAGKMELAPIKAKYIDQIVMPGIVSGEALNNELIYGGPNEAAALCLRHVPIASPGCEFTVGDWANIESRVCAWIAGETWKLEAFRLKDAGRGADLYKLLFSQFFGVPIDQVDDVMRQAGKVCDLAFQFHGGVGALVTMSATYSLDLDAVAPIVLAKATPEQLKKAERAWRRAFLADEDHDLPKATYLACDVLKQVYRASNKATDQLAYDLDNAVKNALRERGTCYEVAKCKIWATGDFLIVQLPSGRRLMYAKPTLHEERDVDPDTGKETRRSYVTYLANRGKHRFREKAWSGLFVENIVQAIANDVMRWAAVAVHEDALTVPEIATYLGTLPELQRTVLVLDVHDELVLDVPQGSYPLKRMLGIMTKGFSWTAGLPLAAEGWQNSRYGKRA